MKALIVGASAGFGKDLCYSLAGKGYSLVITSSDKKDLIPLVADIKFKFGTKISYFVIDAKDPISSISKIIKFFKNQSKPNVILFPIGFVSDLDNLNYHFKNFDNIFNVNLKVIVGICSFMIPFMKKLKSPVIVGFGSIASVRGRDKNIVYSAAKRALESYFESLRFAMQDTNLLVQFYRLGYIESHSSIYKKLVFKPYRSVLLANKVTANLNKDFGISTQPFFWSIISQILKLLPWFLFKKIKQ